MVRNPKDHNSGDALDPGRNLRGILNFPSLNFQSIAKESGHNLSFNEDVNLCNMSIMVQDDAFNSSGPMELTLAEENDPLTAMEGKKRQRLWGPRQFVNIWNDPWLPGHENNRLSVQSINTSWTTVNQLIDFESSTWRKEVIRSLFDEDQARRILSILLGCQSSHDLLVWKFEGSGTYSVKSGRLSVDVACLLCKETPEDSDHLLWKCEVLQQL
ncbi:hypothetical protein PVK06_029228 [Gossypium arboreum]|uniref:Reverse transcriptase zinc-binding domain-containing protein n=1 Tax=Gossypium arboreum TaxID=29729 RepID=A0ABR0P601_GOSAR|nr:hypothetical protein PVK06_029228 [Gossypium arboreum]